MTITTPCGRRMTEREFEQAHLLRGCIRCSRLYPRKKKAVARTPSANLRLSRGVLELEVFGAPCGIWIERDEFLGIHLPYCTRCTRVMVRNNGVLYKKDVQV